MKHGGRKREPEGKRERGREKGREEANRAYVGLGI